MNIVKVSSTAKIGTLVAVSIIISAFLIVYSDSTTSIDFTTGQDVSRWYSKQQVSLGKSIYNTHCVRCHNPEARGISNWKKTLKDGSYPPPPLNGTAHSWHHSLSTLLHNPTIIGILEKISVSFDLPEKNFF